MQKITPFLWFDKSASAAADLYCSLFKNSKITDKTILKDTPSGDTEIVNIKLEGQEFGLISAGPFFKFTPAISFLIRCESKEEVDQIWEKLAPKGTALMELGEYPFSPRYGWIQDEYGLSWQVMFDPEKHTSQKITPTLMFVGNQAGKAEEAVNFYIKTFAHSQVSEAMRYGRNEEPDKEGTLKHMEFTLEGQNFAVMDSAHEHKFTFNEAISFVVHCETQEEIDRYWSRMSSDPSAEQCGWLKDPYGVSWQIVPNILQKMLGNPEKRDQVTQAFLKMKKFDIKTLEEAYRG